MRGLKPISSWIPQALSDSAEIDVRLRCGNILTPLFRRFDALLQRRRFTFLAAAFGATVCLATTAFAADRASPEDAKALLAKAVAHVKEVGADKAFADFMVKPDPWVDRDLYVTAYDLNGKTLAHGNNPRVVGKDNIKLQDANGRFIIEERMEIVKSKGKGQQEYAFLNPATKQIDPS